MLSMESSWAVFGPTPFKYQLRLSVSSGWFIRLELT